MVQWIGKTSFTDTHTPEVSGYAPTVPREIDEETRLRLETDVGMNDYFKALAEKRASSEFGRVAERSKAAVSKAVVSKGTVGSNPTSSAKLCKGV